MDDNEKVHEASENATYDEAAPGTSTAASPPVCVIVLGMAGAGKTTFVQRLTSHLYTKKLTPYVLNLDPAVNDVPFPANIDIRDTVNYKEVMKQYNLGPNGAIMTSLNLFATRFDQVLELMEKRQSEFKYALFDTPGQIEVFTWSASGSIITEALAASWPTVVCYVMDAARCVSPVTFMSNMLYACSILYRSRLPFIVVLNKADVVKPTYALEWMRDFESFQEALNEHASCASDLARSLSLVLDQFYEKLNCVCVSAATGEGVDDLLVAIEKARVEFDTDYKPELERLKKQKQKDKLSEQAAQLERLRLDKNLDSTELARMANRPMTAAAAASLRLTIGDAEVQDAQDEMAQVALGGDDSDDDPADVEAFQRFLAENKQES